MSDEKWFTLFKVTVEWPSSAKLRRRPFKDSFGIIKGRRGVKLRVKHNWMIGELCCHWKGLKKRGI